MTEQQKKLTEPILETIQNDDVRDFAIALLNDLPSYIWEVPASSTGKYHPQYSLGNGGLMRHQIAVVRFLNFFFELEQYHNKFTDRQLDLMRVASLIHDGRKSGEQSDYMRSKYTKFDHPIRMANIVRSFDGKYLNHEEIEFVANCIESHMGQWNVDKKTGEVLPKPTSEFQCFVHLADYLASRKCLTMDFDGYSQPKPEIPSLNDYTITFGKYGKDGGIKLIDLWKTHKDYVLWLKENVHKEPLQTLIKQLEKQEDDEI